MPAEKAEHRRRVVSILHHISRRAVVRCALGVSRERKHEAFIAAWSLGDQMASACTGGLSEVWHRDRKGEKMKGGRGGGGGWPDVWCAIKRRLDVSRRVTVSPLHNCMQLAALWRAGLGCKATGRGDREGRGGWRWGCKSEGCGS